MIRFAEGQELPHGFYRTLAIGLALYLLLAWADIHLTLTGTGGDAALEANPLIRFMMETFGPLSGLLWVKGTVGVLAVLFCFATAYGIHQRRPWVYYLAFFPFSRAWMQRKPRYWVAYSVLYLVAAAQGLAALSWAYLIYGP